MIDQYCRDSFQKRFVNPLLQVSFVQNLSSETITLMGAFLGLLSSFGFAAGYLYTSCMLLLGSGYLDILDGSHARACKKPSAKGAVLDIFCDRCVECTTIFALFWINPIERAAVCLWMLGSCFLCVTSFLVVGIFTENASQKGFYYSPGMIERAEAFFFFIAMAIFPSYAVSLGWLFTTLVLATSLIRLREFFLQTSIL